MPQVVAHGDLYQHVARIEQALAGHFAAAAQFHHLFGGDENPADLVRVSEGLCPAAQTLRHFLLEARVGVDDIPIHPRGGFGAACHGGWLCFDHRLGQGGLLRRGQLDRLRLRRLRLGSDLLRFHGTHFVFVCHRGTVTIPW